MTFICLDASWSQLSSSISAIFMVAGKIGRGSRKDKGSPVLETSLGFRSLFQSTAVSSQVTQAINPAVGCHILSTRPAVTSPATEHHCPLASTKLYCLVTESRVNNLPRVAFGSTAARIRTHDLLIASLAP